MKLVYTHENIFLLNHVRALLEQAGIQVVTRNVYAGGGSGELPVFETWPELWVASEAGYAQALEIVASMQSAAPGDEWVCPHCLERNDPSFETCWKCQAAHEPGTAPG